MITAIYAGLAAVAGMCIALQAPANSKLRAHLGDPVLAGFGSVCGTFLSAVAITVTYVLIARPVIPAWEVFRGTPWWTWIGGPLGALFVLAGAVLARELGAAVFFSFVIGGQLLSSLIVDHFALMGLPEQTLTPGRAVGAVLVVAGVVCIKYL